MNIDPNSKIPLYLQLKEVLLDKIKNQEWKVGAKIPTEIELQEELGVSRITVRHAIEILETEGYVERKRGKGTFVSPPKFSYHLPKLTSFSEDVTQKKCVPGSKTLTLEVVSEPETAVRMGIAEATPLMHMVRLRTVNNIIMGMHDCYYNLNTLDSNLIIRNIASGELLDKLDEKSISFYDILENEYHLKIEYADETLKAISSTPDVAEQLGISINEPLLFLERTTYTTEGTVVEFSKMYNRADIYTYTIRLTR